MKGSNVHTIRLLGKACVVFSCSLVMMSCSDAPRELGTGPVSEQADAGKLELGKEYPLPDEAAHIKEISRSLHRDERAQVSAERPSDAA